MVIREYVVNTHEGELELVRAAEATAGDLAFADVWSIP